MPVERSFPLFKKKGKTNRRSPTLPLPSLNIWITNWNSATEVFGAGQILPKRRAELASGLLLDSINQLVGEHFHSQLLTWGEGLSAMSGAFIHFIIL